MGRKCPCEGIVLPAVPVVKNCIAGANGICFDDGQELPVKNMVCRPASEDASLFNWIDWVKTQVGQ